MEIYYLFLLKKRYPQKPTGKNMSHIFTRKTENTQGEINNTSVRKAKFCWKGTTANTTQHRVATLHGTTLIIYGGAQ